MANTRRPAHVASPAARRGQAALFRRRDRVAQLAAADYGGPARELIRQPGNVVDRTFEVTFLDPDVQAYVFTFG